MRTALVIGGLIGSFWLLNKLKAKAEAAVPAARKDMLPGMGNMLVPSPDDGKWITLGGSVEDAQAALDSAQAAYDAARAALAKLNWAPKNYTAKTKWLKARSVATSRTLAAKKNLSAAQAALRKAQTAAGATAASSGSTAPASSGGSSIAPSSSSSSSSSGGGSPYSSSDWESAPASSDYIQPSLEQFRQQYIETGLRQQYIKTGPPQAAPVPVSVTSVETPSATTLPAEEAPAPAGGGAGTALLVGGGIAAALLAMR